MQVVYIDCDSFELGVAPFDRTEPRVVEHGLAEPEITCVQHCPHLALEKEHDGARTMERIHEDDLDALLAILVNVDPMLFVHFEVNDEVSEAREALRDQLLGEVARVNLSMVPVVGEAAEVILVAMTEEVDVSGLVLLPVLEVVYSDV